MAGAASAQNVRILESAWRALEEIKTARGLSRDATVRLLLSDHIAAQQKLEPDDRLTHIVAAPRPAGTSRAPRLSGAAAHRCRRHRHRPPAPVHRRRPRRADATHPA